MKIYKITLYGPTWEEDGTRLKDFVQFKSETSTEALLRLTHERLDNMFLNYDREHGIYFKPLAFDIIEIKGVDNENS